MRVEKIGLATLYLGDNREIAPTLERPAAVISDPPYGMAWNTDSSRFSHPKSGRPVGKGRADWGAITQDNEPFQPAPWLAMAPRVVLWGANHYAQRLPVGRTLVWVKKAPENFGTFLSDGEIGWASGGAWRLLHGEAIPPPKQNGGGA